VQPHDYKLHPLQGHSSNAQTALEMMEFVYFEAAGAKRRDVNAAVQCVQGQLAQELEKYELEFKPPPFCCFYAAAAAARVAVLMGLARGQLLSCILPQDADAVVEDAVKVGLRLGLLPFYKHKLGPSSYVVC